MTVFTNLLSAPIEQNNDETREDILQVCRLFREDRIARLNQRDLAEFRKAA